MQKGPPTPKGFRDILPDLAKKHREIINKIADVLEKEGFVPLETPTIEFAETLTGKYGEEEKLIYKFKDRGGRELALRYDLTVPLARFVANNQQLIAKGPFRRYQIGQVFRGENPQHGRYREFTQFDFDSVGSESLTEDAKIIAAVIKSIDALGVKDKTLFINDRKIFADIHPKYVSAIDKLEKIGRDGVLKELVEKGLPSEKAVDLFTKIEITKETDTVKSILDHLDKLGASTSAVKFKPTLARGLNYYTGAIFELDVVGSQAGSVGGGGRYDNLIGSFAKKEIPAVGFSFGLDRLIETLE
ncbi:histidine--tRNA ligase [Candidatus Curtissbacteria bacterium RIFCSPHIGHO2_01_FULL_41_11]|uniref:Histidine--tRNA ligase n=1 Tax=Candidatus Curtissbacteria bacterium RIFCSPHIGHO2_01_FULL_41_11 TaxID=1797711 RepID=A0A1F5G5Q0_9BACT|nr:MAG: histidine--tRNA ligase [Candidatus Curtissbacteria bacterium RIFCSPHIGHO2_01_FULL_41_11]